MEHSSNLEGGCHLENRDVSLKDITSITFSLSTYDPVSYLVVHGGVDMNTTRLRDI